MNIISKVQSRAYPTQRLVRTFGIDNAFTTTNENYRKDFRSYAKEKITLDDGRLKTIADLAKQLVGIAIPQPGSDIASIRLDSLGQSVLHVLFDLDPLQLDDELIVEIARSINFLWIESKSAQLCPTSSSLNVPSVTIKQLISSLLSILSPSS